METHITPLIPLNTPSRARFPLVSLCCSVLRVAPVMRVVLAASTPFDTQLHYHLFRFHPVYCCSVLRVAPVMRVVLKARMLPEWSTQWRHSLTMQVSRNFFGTERVGGGWGW